jgi:hypothetical protein
MPKTKISEFSATPGNNTDIDGINIAEGCAPSGINDAIRELMAQLKDFQAGTAGDSFNGPVGTSTAAAGAFTTLSASGAVTLSGGTSNGVAYLNGSKVLTTGSALTFDGTRLGINIASPTLTLEVGGNAATGYMHSGVGVLSIGSKTNFPVGFDVNNTEQMRLTSTGLGIGTSSPVAKLDVSGNAVLSGVSGYKYLYFNGVTENSSLRFAKIGKNYDSTFELGIWASTHSAGNSAATVFYRDLTTESMRLDSSGNLGLGVTPPASGSRAIYTGFATSASLCMSMGASGGSYGVVGYNTGITNTSNAYNYMTADTASAIRFSAGGFHFLTAPSGTAGNAITFTQAMTLDASGNLGIGETSPGQTLAVKNSSSPIIRVGDGTRHVELRGGSTTQNPAVGTYYGGDFTFVTNSTERARITSGGQLQFACTNDGPAQNNVTGFSVNSTGVTEVSASSATPFFVNRKTNDGTLVSLRQDGTEEGTISVSGTTVSYNGGHLSRWSQLPDNSKDDDILKGTVMSNLDAMCEWVKDGQPLPNEQLNRMKVSDVEGDTNVAGVFVNWTRDEDCNTDDMNVAMTGDMIIRIAQGVTVQRGDLLMSAGDGTAKPQGDDIRRSKTVAKVTSTHVTCTYADGSYCVPCVLMAC